MADLRKEIEKRRTFAIISHPDAGKTTLTEKFLLYGGAINLAGSVKGKATARHAVSDWMDILSIYICPLGAGLAGIMFFWIAGKKYVETQVNKGRETKFTKMYCPICKYIYVPICILVLVLGIALGGIG